MKLITANIHQKPVPMNTPMNETRLTVAAIWTMAIRLPVRSAMWPQTLGAKMRITWSSDISTPIWKASNCSERR